jgi:hypothetical protein
MKGMMALPHPVLILNQQSAEQVIWSADVVHAFLSTHTHDSALSSHIDFSASPCTHSKRSNFKIVHLFIDFLSNKNIYRRVRVVAMQQTTVQIKRTG